LAIGCKLLGGEGEIGEGRVLDPEIFAGAAAFAQSFGFGQAGFAQVFKRFPGADHAGDRIAVGDADAGMPKQQRREHQIGTGRSTAQKGEVRRGNGFGVSVRSLIHAGAHANSPCRNQRGNSLSRS
jgi:hypothetical protein